MKLIPLILFSALNLNVILSQDIVIANKQWEGDQYNFPFEPVTRFNSKFRSSLKLINGKNYRELMYKVDDGWFEGVRQYYREEDNKVYKSVDGIEQVILDFGLAIGDTLQISNNEGDNFYFVPYRAVDTIVQSINRRKLELRAYPVGSDNRGTKHVWIEGVGDIGFFFGGGNVFNDQKASVVYCVKDDVYIYGAGLFCPFFIATNTVENEPIADYVYDFRSKVIHVKNEKIKVLDIYSIGGIKLNSFPINSFRNTVDLSSIDLPLCVIVIFDGEKYQSKILKL